MVIVTLKDKLAHFLNVYYPVWNHISRTNELEHLAASFLTTNRCFYYTAGRSQLFGQDTALTSGTRVLNLLFCVKFPVNEDDVAVWSANSRRT